MYLQKNTDIFPLILLFGLFPVEKVRLESGKIIDVLIVDFIKTQIHVGNPFWVYDLKHCFRKNGRQFPVSHCYDRILSSETLTCNFLI